jgi:hypothetical protein
LRVIARLGARVRLREGLERLLHQLDRDPFAALLAHHRTVVAEVGGDGLAGHAGRRLVGQRQAHCAQGALAAAVSVDKLAVFFGHRFEIFVDHVAAARGVHPAGLVVETLVDEELAPGHGAIGVQALFADHVDFWAEVKRGMGIDQQERVPGGAQPGGDGKAVRAARFFVAQLARIGQRRLLAVELLQGLEIDRFDVAADAAFAEGERHPRLEMRDQLGLDLGMRVQVEVQAIGKGHHQLLEPGRAGRVPGLHGGRRDEHLHAQVAPDFGLAFDFGQAPERIDVIEFDPPEIVLRLRIQQAEDRIGIALAEHVGDAPLVAHDGHAPGALVPARLFGRQAGAPLRRGAGGRQRREGGASQQGGDEKGAKQGAWHR